MFYFFERESGVGEGKERGDWVLNRLCTEYRAGHGALPHDLSRNQKSITQPTEPLRIPIYMYF